MRTREVEVTSADRGSHVVSVKDPHDRIFGFLDRSRYFSIKYLLSCTHKAEWTPFQTHYFFCSARESNIYIYSKRVSMCNVK
jgi:hypothetical protein